MNFSDLYINNTQDVEKKIATLWGGEANTVSQRAQVEKLKEQIHNIFAPEEAVPVVQCMNSYKSVHSVKPSDAKALVGSLWTSSFDPYEHQYDSWNTLLNGHHDGKPMSICVTTGTGSGKTECFMMPLVYDLAQPKNYQSGQIQAIFLYPLNALMEDQKERLEKMLENIEKSTGVKLTYTVYNGDLPDEVPSVNDTSDEAERTRRKIDMIRGLITDSQGQPIPDSNGDKQYKYSRMIYTRKDVRRKDCAPNILLTNPTMLEYILLRKSDENLIDPKKKSLRWVAIDETHTYTGAGAAELAMLLRRVMLAFGQDAQTVRFATSSATFVNNEDIKDPVLREKKEKEAKENLQKFISNLTGTSIPQVKVIDGEREGEELLKTCTLPEEEKNLWEKICKADFIELNKLFSEGSIAEKLKRLDEMCQHIEDIYAKDKEQFGDNAKLLMKCKVHYFYRVPNNGMYVRLNEFENGAFKVYTQKPLEQEEDKLPLLELCRCKHCGEFLAVGMLEKPNGKLYPVESDDSDMFDLGVDEDDAEINQTVFALSNTPVSNDDHTGSYDVNGLQVVPSTANSYKPNDWHLIGNEYRECPCCRKKLTRYSSTKKDENTDAENNQEDLRLQKLRLSSEFISRILAPTTLDQLDQATSSNSITLHSGQQYMSFVDSRQAAAKSTMNQNLEQERLWFYTTIYHELCRRKLGKLSVQEAIDAQMQKSQQAISSGDADAMVRAASIIQNLKSNDPSVVENQLAKLSDSPIMSWDEIAKLLLDDDYFMVFCHQFIKRTEDSEDLETDGSIKNEAKLKYLYSIMVLYLGNRPATAASHETMGLFRPCYPFLKDLKAPQSFTNLNNVLKNTKVCDDDWQNLIQVFLDYTVRSNQSVFLSMGNGNHIYDIFSCERYATVKPRRRPVKKPAYENPGDISDSRLVRFISGLITRDLGLNDDNQTQRVYFNVIKPIIDDLWKTLEDNNILEKGTHYDEDKDKTKQIPDKDESALRFNLAKMSFALYDDVYLCDTNTEAKVNHVVKLRPVQVNFMGFSPYLIGDRAVPLDSNLHEKWDCFDACKGSGKKYDEQSLKLWASQKRSLLWSNGLWGEDGVFSDRLNNIHLIPNLFIQGEHTAQVDKIVARQLQAQFKDHSINILACSTTMEMGVDLGNLELVMLTSVPPLPANYKQRAGRSGRNNKVKSVCITLCGSDAIGLRTLFNPIETIIKRPVDVPTVDLDSQQVVMRHVISYLIRSFGVFASGDNGGSLNQKVVDFYTPFRAVWNDNLHCHIYYDENNTKIEDVDSGLGNPAGTNYEAFSRECDKPMSQNMKNDMQTLLKGTPFIGSPNEVLRIAKKENERCYNELADKVENLKLAKRNADQSSKGFDSYMRLLNMEYQEILGEKLLNYWPTNRFTPNANMPVNIMSLDLNATKLKSKKDKKRNVSNPSYTLRQAIQQYVPGNSLVVDGVVYIVRGLTTQDAYTHGRTIKQLYRNANKTVVGEDATLDTSIPWDVNGRQNLSLVQPVRFLPDPNEDYSRIMDDNIYTHVSAQLIGTRDWKNKVTEPNLFSTRRSDNSGNAKILYYNEGMGYGYAMCIDCGKMCIETGQVEEGKASIPEDIDDRQNDKGRYHYSIDREKKHLCYGSRKKERIKRNVIIGDLMQTDYCEIRFRHKDDTSWITFSPNEETDRKNRNLLITLGITICQALVELKGWERGSVDFAVMQNRHLCIFDTNPGGAGYSVKLHDNQTMLDVIASVKTLLLKAQEKDCKDMLLDKFTLRFLKYIDIDGALEWIQEQEDAQGIYPEPIPTVFDVEKVHQSSIRELLSAFSASTQRSTIFVDDNFNKWDFGASDSGWQGRLISSFFGRRSSTSFCIARKGNTVIPEGALQMLRDIKVFFDNPVEVDYMSDKDIYPLAYIDGRLYFTINDDSSSLNEYWGDGLLYCINTDNPAEKAKEIDCRIDEETTQIFFLDDASCEEKYSHEIGELIYSYDKKTQRIIDKFIAHCKSSNDEINISYLDKYMVSVASVVLTLQTIDFFVKQLTKNFNLDFLLEEYDSYQQKREVFARLESSNKRDSVLDDMANIWMDDLYAKDHIQGQLGHIKSVDASELPHWRVLNFECNGKRLSIYPDGGLLNGWKLGKLRPGEHFYTDTTEFDDHIPLIRQKPIKFEVHIENIDN